MENNLALMYWISNGWRIFRNNPKLMILGAMIYSSTYIISGLLANLPSGCYFLLAIELLISIPLTAGWWFLSLQLVRGRSVKLLDIFAGFRCFLRVWITFMLTTLVTLSISYRYLDWRTNYFLRAISLRQLRVCVREVSSLLRCLIFLLLKNFFKGSLEERLGKAKSSNSLYSSLQIHLIALPQITR